MQRLLLFTFALFVGCTSPADPDGATDEQSVSSDNGHAAGHPASSATDGDVTTYWEGAPNAYPNVLTVDLGSARRLTNVIVKLNPDPIWTRRVQTFDIAASDDGRSFRTLVARADYVFDPAHGNQVVVPFGPWSTRNLRLTFFANSGAPAGQVAELEAHEDGGPRRYEAENAALAGGAKANTDHAGYSGSAFVDGYLAPGAVTTFDVEVDREGDYGVVLRYANATGAAQTLRMTAGAEARTITLPNLVGWDAWADATEVVHLARGRNRIAYAFAGDATGNVNLDWIRIDPASGRGARLPYLEYEAEAGRTNGTILGASRAWSDIAGEASGRQAVRLDRTGQFVEIRSRARASSLVVRYAIPDAPGGGGADATLSVYVDGTFRRKLALTSKYAWVYGGWRNVATDQWSNDPRAGAAHHFFDEARVMLDAIAPGATVRLQKDDGDAAAWYVVDLIDLEDVPPPIAAPAGSLVVTSFGAVADDGIDDAAAIQSAVDAGRAQNKIVFFPPGTFEASSAAISVSDVTIQGSGMWHTTIHGPKATFVCTGNGCRYHDFAILGETTSRNDNTQDNGFHGSAGTGSILENVWIEHTKCGYWVGGGGLRTDGLVIRGCRIRNTFADGVNFCDGTHDSVVEHTHARNTGDDAFASWSPAPGPVNAHNVFRFDTVQSPWFANGYALYGGDSNAIEDSVVSDVATTAGVLVAQDFSSNAFAGTTRVERTSIVRAGGNWWGPSNGALKLSPAQAFMRGFVVRDVEIRDATSFGIQIAGPNGMDTTYFQNVLVEGAGTFGIGFDRGAFGAANFDYVLVRRPTSGTVDRGDGRFQTILGTGNAL